MPEAEWQVDEDLGGQASALDGRQRVVDMGQGDGQKDGHDEGYNCLTASKSAKRHVLQGLARVFEDDLLDEDGVEDAYASETPSNTIDYGFVTLIRELENDQSQQQCVDDAPALDFRLLRPAFFVGCKERLTCRRHSGLV